MTEQDWKAPHASHLPSPEEEKAIRNEIDELQAKIQNLDEQIATLEVARTKFHQELENKIAFLAPIRRLPPELVAEIATYCLHMKEGPKPWTLNQVSKQFYAAISRAKAFWTTLLITEETTIEPSEDARIACRSAERLQEMVERTSPTPIKIIVDSGLTEDIYQVLRVHSKRIKALALPGLGSLLEQESDSAVWDNEDKSTYLNLENIQFLKVMELDQLSDEFLALLDMVAASQQRNLGLCLAGIEPDILPSLLGNAVLDRLTKLDIHSSINSGETIQWEQDCILPRLETLILRDDAICAYAALQTPNLRDLGIYENFKHIIQIKDLPTTLLRLKVVKSTLDMSTTSSKVISFPLLTRIKLFDVRIRRTEDGFKLSLDQLEELLLSAVYPQLEDGLRGLFGHLPRLKRLWLDRHFYHSIFGTFTFTPNLIALRITSSDIPTDQQLLNLLRTTPDTLPLLDELLISPVTDRDQYMTEFNACASARPSLRMRDSNLGCVHRFEGDTSWHDSHSKLNFV